MLVCEFGLGCRYAPNDGLGASVASSNSEEIVPGREHCCADMTQVLGHAELAANPEEQGDYQSDQGAGHIPWPGLRKQLEHR